MKRMKELARWIGACLLAVSAAVSAAVWAQPATLAGGTLTIPAIRVGTATYVDVTLGLVNAANYTFRLTGANEQIPAGATSNLFSTATGLVILPAVVVGNNVYTNVVLRLTDAATYTFILAAATPPGSVTYTIGGTVSGLSGSGLVLRNNGNDELAVSGSGAFVFVDALGSGANYAVTVATQPVAQHCTVPNGSGAVAGANVGNVAVACADIAFVAGAPRMASTRIFHAATLLDDGRVLITGGLLDSSKVALDSAELYDPATDRFALLGARMNSLRNQHTATRLPNGQVLIAGGSDNGSGDGIDTAELYDPATRVFTPLAARMTTPRGGHTATLLANGKVLLAGGFYNSSTSHNSAELYDPATLTFTALAGTMAARRAGHAASELPGGQVLLVGGGSSRVVTGSAELYDPTTQTFAALGASMKTVSPLRAAAPLPDGRILISGGGNRPTNFNALDTAELYDPSARTFIALSARMSTPRGGHSATLLPSGAVVLIGGATDSNGALRTLDTVETYGP